MSERKIRDFLDLKNEPVFGVNEGSELLNSMRKTAAEMTVATVNKLEAELGFTLTIRLEPTKHKGYNQVIITSSKPVHPDFFHIGNGLFWSTLRSIDVGNKLVNVISPEESETIFRAEVAGINTIQLIGDGIQKFASSDRKTQWQGAMAEIQSQLQVVS